MLISKFLLRILPIILLSTALFFIGLVYFKKLEIIQEHKLISKDWAANDASLLARPLWQLEENALVDVLKTQVKRPRVHCIRLTQKAPSLPEVLQQGNCQDKANYYILKTPILFFDRSWEKNIGELEHWVDITPSTDELTEKLFPPLVMLIILMFVLVVCVWIAFRYLILLPLSKVSHSIAVFTQEGRREAAEWDSDDELGQLIKKYNQSLVDQERSELDLKESIAQTNQTLQVLQQTQQSLIEAEKLASLGRLVAGIAHEINTPLGSSLTVVSTLNNRTKAFKQEIEAGALRKSALMEYIESNEEANRIMLRSLTAAAEQIQNFKQVAVDQTSEKRRPFILKNTLEEVLSTLKPTVKHNTIHCELNIPEDIQMDSYPGPFGQVVSNLFTNAVIHAFEHIAEGFFRIEASYLDSNQVQIIFADNGCGMAKEQLKYIYEPFFTSKLGKGGSGLGMHMVYNIVTGLLGGTITVKSVVGEGTQISLILPVVAPHNTNISKEMASA